MAGLKPREIAIARYGLRRVEREWHSDGTMRATVRYRIKRGKYLMNGGYLKLAARR